MQCQLGIVVTHRHLDRLGFLLESVRPLRANHLLPNRLTRCIFDELYAHRVVACTAVVCIVRVDHLDMRLRKSKRRWTATLVVGTVIEPDIFVAIAQQDHLGGMPRSASIVMNFHVGHARRIDRELPLVRDDPCLSGSISDTRRGRGSRC